MSKDKKPKQRPDKYAEKVKLNTSFEQTLKIFADGANKKVEKDRSKKSDK